MQTAKAQLVSQRRFRSPLGFSQLQADSYAMQHQHTVQPHHGNEVTD